MIDSFGPFILSDSNNTTHEDEHKVNATQEGENSTEGLCNEEGPSLRERLLNNSDPEIQMRKLEKILLDRSASKYQRIKAFKQWLDDCDSIESRCRSYLNHANLLENDKQQARDIAVKFRQRMILVYSKIKLSDEEKRVCIVSRNLKSSDWLPSS